MVVEGQNQGTTLTFQLTNLVASGNVDITSQRRFLLAKRCNSEMSSLRKTGTSSVNFILFTSQSGQWKQKIYQSKLNFYQSVASWLALMSSPENGVNKRHCIVANHQRSSHSAVLLGILRKFLSFRTFLTNFTNALIKVNSVPVILPEVTTKCLILFCIIYSLFVIYTLLSFTVFQPFKHFLTNLIYQISFSKYIFLMFM